MNKKPTKAKNHNLSITNAGSSDRAVRARRTPNPYPTEDQEQMALANWLNLMFGDEWEHVPSQRWARVQYLTKLKRMGAKKGSLDLRIYRPVKRGLETIACGVAIEMKRKKGGRVTLEQLDFSSMLHRCGWITFVANGCKDAINKIEEVYGKL